MPNDSPSSIGVPRRGAGPHIHAARAIVARLLRSISHAGRLSLIRAEIRRRETEIDGGTDSVDEYLAGVAGLARELGRPPELRILRNHLLITMANDAMDREAVHALT
jgi:hypothetical protein